MRLPVIGHLSDRPTAWPLDQPVSCWCGTAADTWVTGRAGDGTRMDLWECSGCSTMRVSPYLSERSISELYTDYMKNSPDEFDVEYTRTQQQRNFIQSNRLRFSSILDWGCGVGGGLSVWRGNYPKAVIEGLEIDPVSTALAIARDFRVKSQVWARYDLITISHVLEHVRDPLALLLSARGNLTPSGVVFAEVPHVPRTLWNWKWIYQTELPHCWYFQPEGFRELFVRAGYRVQDIDTGRDIRIFASPKQAAEEWMGRFDPWEGRHANSA